MRCRKRSKSPPEDARTGERYILRIPRDPWRHPTCTAPERSGGRQFDKSGRWARTRSLKPMTTLSSDEQGGRSSPDVHAQLCLGDAIERRSPVARPPFRAPWPPIPNSLHPRPRPCPQDRSANPGRPKPRQSGLRNRFQAGVSARGRSRAHSAARHDEEVVLTRTPVPPERRPRAARSRSPRRRAPPPVGDERFAPDLRLALRPHVAGDQLHGRPDPEADDDEIVQQAEDGDEVGNQVDRRERVEQRERPDRLRVPRRARMPDGAGKDDAAPHEGSGLLAKRGHAFTMARGVAP